MVSKVRRSILTSLSIIFASIVVAGVAIYFLQSDIVTQRDAIVEARAMIARDSQTSGRLAQLKMEAPIAERYGRVMSLFIPPQDQLLAFPSWIDSLARPRKVAVTVTFQGDPSPAKDVNPGTVPFLIDASGAFEDVVGFLNDAEAKSTKFLIRFDSIELTRSSGQYRALAGGRVFFR